VYYSPHGPVPSPLLSVDWKSTNSTEYDLKQVGIEISAVSGELLHFTDDGYTFTKRKQPLGVDLKALKAIRDDEFLKYSTLDRSNLLVRFAGIHCTDLHCPGMPDALNRETNAVAKTPLKANSTVSVSPGTY